jgi:hypothetical protein
MWFTPIPHIIGEGLENERGSEGELKRILGSSTSIDRGIGRWK